jgi:dihydroorotate dehydrogenase
MKTDDHDRLEVLRELAQALLTSTQIPRLGGVLTLGGTGTAILLGADTLSVGVQSCARTGKHLQNLAERVSTPLAEGFDL